MRNFIYPIKLFLVNGFSAILTDLIRTPDFSWKEAKKVIYLSF